MGRRVRTDVPETDEHFIPDWQFLSEFRKKDEEYKRKQKESYDEHHRIRSLDPLQIIQQSGLGQTTLCLLEL